MPEGNTFGKYLGFPIFMKRPANQDFQFLLDNFKTRLSGWKTKLLSKAERVTLVKSTLNTLPNHVMQLIALPLNIIRRLEQYERNFLWRTTTQQRKIHLLNWNVVTSPKAEGGLGIQRLQQKIPSSPS